MGAGNLVGQFHIQDFLDKIADLDLDPRIQSWYTVDVTAMLGETKIIHHEINDETGCSLIFRRMYKWPCTSESETCSKNQKV